MPVIASGTEHVETKNKNYGTKSVAVPGMLADDQVLVSAVVTGAGAHPVSKGPLFCVFVQEAKKNGFDILVYDIQKQAHEVTVPVHWAVVRNR